MFSNRTEKAIPLPPSDLRMSIPSMDFDGRLVAIMFCLTMQAFHMSHLEDTIECTQFQRPISIFNQQNYFIIISTSLLQAVTVPKTPDKNNEEIAIELRSSSSKTHRFKHKYKANCNSTHLYTLEPSVTSIALKALQYSTVTSFTYSPTYSLLQKKLSGFKLYYNGASRSTLYS